MGTGGRWLREAGAAALLAWLVSLPPAPSGAGECAPAAEATVILLSWDGVRHDYPELHGGARALPALARMGREGARAQALVPVFPASTFPNHVSLATGTYPDRHGIVGNRFLDREHGLFDYGNDARWIRAEPLWVAAERQGVRSAVHFWVGSETDWQGVGASYRKAPFDDDLPERAKVRQLLAWLDLPAAQRPRLILGWWHGADSAGHRHGPEAAETAAQLRGQDRELAGLLAGLDAREAWSRTTLMLVSDHGMATGREALDPQEVLANRGLRAQVLAGGGFAHVYLERPEQREAAREALQAMPGVQVHRGEELPERLRARDAQRGGDLVLTTRPPRYFRRVGSRRALLGRLAGLLGRDHGVHGYDPRDHPEMDGLLLALGRGVPAGLRPGRLRVVDVAPTVAGLLGIAAPRHAEGGRIPGIGCDAPPVP